jgi:acyl carrier protein
MTAAPWQTKPDEVLSALRRAMPHLEAALRPEIPMSQIALDSLDLVELLCVIESTFGTRIGQEDFDRAATVGDLAAIVANASGTMKSAEGRS